MQAQQSIFLPLRFNQVVEAIQQLSQTDKQRLMAYLLKQQPNEEDLTLTHLASEQTLAKNWLTKTEDKA